ncbi:receptor-like protein 35 isoform X1 [Brassica napus]|uniref:receptor-like protein 35 isoform X1 n=2 Tax=Brassica napus TaxID=3708 RepID=UPI002078E282|nr:receptor-like protein 35 isoform X1 [Brassica napus]
MKGFWNLTSTISLTLSILFLFGYSYEDVSAVPTTHLCRPDQRDALLQFKNEFEVLNSSVDSLCIINKTIVKPLRKTESWMNNSDCCNWEGITCNPNSGEVVELDLSCSNLRGKFHSKSSLRNLHSLTTLLLSNNDFSGPIMSLIGNLSHLTSLDLSRNGFSEFIPSSKVDLSYLTFLDLSSNSFSGQIPSSIGNLSYLTFLDLSFNSFSGEIPSWIGNLSHLTYLNLELNQISGKIPSSIGNLYNLTYLYLSGNNIVGEIPSFFGNLNQLTTLGVAVNRLNGSFPIALLNLTKLSYLGLYYNQFTGTIPHNITSLSKLTYFVASNNAFTGTLPSSLFTIPSMESVILHDNQLNGILEFGNISSPPQLRKLDVGNNNLRGPIPAAISKFTNLVRLDLSHYKTQAPVDFNIFWHLKRLEDLDLSYLNTTTTTIDLNYILSYFKRLSVLDLSGNHVSATNKSSVSGPPLLRYLELSGCGITELPEFVRNQHMEWLDISNNKIKGQVPGWLWTLPNLTYLNLSNNTFTGFEKPTTILLSRLSSLNLLASNNNFTGKIPSFICDLRSVYILDLSNNNFSGLIPPCLGNLNRSLEFLNLRQNRLHGGLPETIFESLRTLDVGHNQLTGKLPRSLIHFSSLEVLNVESNIFNDTFPFWLHSLPELKILVLRSNAFHGPILQTSFPKLQIIDISHNHFNGSLSSDYFVKWSAMLSLGKNYDQWDDKYMGGSYYHDSMVLMNKGIEMEFVRILKIYTALDFSGNKFEGEIPRSIGLLKGLLMLNLSNNAFTGHIPSSLGNLTALESLDVSQNQLSGEIPQELGELSFLSYMNFSHNQLTGLVPGGTQFQRLDCTSFEDNPGLFGPSLDEDCRDIHKPTPHETPESEEEEEEEVLSWIAAVIGVIPGIAFGWVIGYILFSYKPEWFIDPFARNKRRISSSTTH